MTKKWFAIKNVNQPFKTLELRNEVQQKYIDANGHICYYNFTTRKWYATKNKTQPSNIVKP